MDARCATFDEGGAHLGEQLDAVIADGEVVVADALDVLGDVFGTDWQKALVRVKDW